jgi:osmoprotectant transport system substrate-binding protein
VKRDDRTIGKVRAARGGVAILLLAALSVASFPLARVTSAARPATHSAATVTLNIGEKNFDEEFIVGDIYALLLQKAGFKYKLHVLGSEPGPFQTAMLRGQLDLYPEYTGTGLVGVLGVPGIANQALAFKTVKRLYEKRYHFTWLQRAPMNDTNAVAVTSATASKYHLKTLSDLARVASQLSFIALPACQGRSDCLAGMQSAYGINFKNVTYVASTSLTTQALVGGQADAAELFSTSPVIKKDGLVVLADNKAKVFPADNLAPLIRDPVLRKYPKIAGILNKVEKYLTTQAVIGLNAKFDLLNQDALSIARKFLKSKHLL